MDNGFLKNKFYSVLTTLLIIGFLGVFSACNTNKGKNNAQPPPPYVVPLPMTAASNCVGCMNMGQLAFMATTDSENIRGSLLLGLDFYGDPSRGFDFNNPKVPALYNGIVEAHGRLQIRAVDTDFCNAPAGEYEVRTVRPGSWQLGVVSGLQLEARSINGFFIVMTFVKGIIYNSTSINGTNKLETNRMGGTFMVELVNGQVCRSLVGSAISLELY